MGTDKKTQITSRDFEEFPPTVKHGFFQYLNPLLIFSILPSILKKFFGSLHLEFHLGSLMNVIGVYNLWRVLSLDEAATTGVEFLQHEEELLPQSIYYWPNFQNLC